MNKRQIKKLCDNYYESLKKEKFDIALKQNRLLYNEIFTHYLESNGDKSNEDKKILEAGLDRLEIDATEILPYVKLNPMEAK